jgi:phenylpyruvate tautomerase
MIVKVTDECVLSFAGTFDPAFNANLYSIGKISPEMNANTSAGLSEYFAKELGLPSDRGYIAFFDVEASNLGYKGATF